MYDKTNVKHRQLQSLRARLVFSAERLSARVFEVRRSAQARAFRAPGGTPSEELSGGRCAEEVLDAALKSRADFLLADKSCLTPDFQL